ncbi:hypothetical protein HK097_009385 [Rhizophlyctis rosea]|uniref:Uncharacterized protein n=1 Tax=Rhizophlyctis rosea TaxID=64517 RepID=A0AAD5S901_9FUNG|nr:hypothetical protein HK097_009385 [Rhizophlyctis rosea]
MGVRSPFYFTDHPSFNNSGVLNIEKSQSLNHIDYLKPLGEVEILPTARTQPCGNVCLTHSLDGVRQGGFARPTDILRIHCEDPQDESSIPRLVTTRTPFKIPETLSPGLEFATNNETIALATFEDTLIAFRLDDQVELSRMPLPMETLDMHLGRTHIFLRNRWGISVVSIYPLRFLYTIPLASNGSIRLTDDSSMIFCWASNVQERVEAHLVDPRRGVICSYALPASKLARYQSGRGRSGLRDYARTVRAPTNGEFFVVIREYPIDTKGKRAGGSSDVKVYWRDYGPPLVPGVLSH